MIRAGARLAGGDIVGGRRVAWVRAGGGRAIFVVIWITQERSVICTGMDGISVILRCTSIG